MPINACGCGRPINPAMPHCPNCGSTNLYGKASAGRIENGVFIRGFRCKRCMVDFAEGEPCRAPLRQIQTAKQRMPIATKSLEMFDPELVEQGMAIARRMKQKDFKNPLTGEVMDFSKEQDDKPDLASAPKAEHSVDNDPGPEV